MRHLVTFACVLLAASIAEAQPLRLRADALATTPSPAGLIVLSGEARPSSYVGAEAVIWGGSGENPADALVALVRLRHPGQRGDLTLGRFVVATGAVRPVHLDGGMLRAKLPAGIGLEAFGGLPVRPLETWNDEQQMGGVSRRIERADWDWVYGGRISETLGTKLGAGASFVERRDFGRIADREVGGDLWLQPTGKLDLASRLSWDLVMAGVSEALVSAAYRPAGYRFELFGTHRSPARLLPATSIFSALGDVPSDTVGLSALWYAAPRLDVLASGSARMAGEIPIDQDASNEPREAEAEIGMDASMRATLRLDDEGKGQVVLELRRFGLDPGEWTGVRLRVRIPVLEDFAVSTELEAVRPDEPADGRGHIWPWGLVAFSGRFLDHWEAALAVEAFASPDKAAALAALGRLAYRWEGP
ncbi:MAG: hypothetical protein HYY06_29890 [Deltaproteobacteria bacterium]|nr:hypothetical protein [Deltaproteobacteria bacterium]